jgi:hypothetical protein
MNSPEDGLFTGLGCSLTVCQVEISTDMKGKVARATPPMRPEAANTAMPYAFASLITYFALGSSAPSAVAQQTIGNEQAICDQVQSYVNTVVDYTKTVCTQAESNDGRHAIVVISSESIFSAETTKKPWMIAVVLSAGKAVNEQTDAERSELYMTDVNLKTAYLLPLDLAGSLQKEVALGHMQIGAMYDQIKKNLARKDVPR